MDFFTKLFTGKKSLEQIVKDVEIDNNESIMFLKGNLNIIIESLLQPIKSQNFKTHNFKSLSLLKDPKQCNKLTIFLGKNIEQNFSRIELSKLADEIFIHKYNKTECKTDDCPKIDEEKYIVNNKNYTKRKLCKLISKHYIKQLNLVASIITAVNPINNFCLMRLKKLLVLLNDNKSKGIIQICKKDNITSGKLLNQPGFKELLNLYYFHLIDSVSKEEDLNSDQIYKVQIEYQNLVTLFNNILSNKYTTPIYNNTTNNINNINNINNNKN